MVWDLAISMMTEEEFWDKFQKKHNSKLYAKKNKNKKKNKSKPKRKRWYSIFKSKSRMD